MALKTLVKVGNITNLSDARYCAGMGVDLLGFGAIEGQSDYIDVTLYQQMRGWISGPKIVTELYGISPDTDLGSIIKNYAPDYIEMSITEYPLWESKTQIPFIVSIKADESDLIESKSNVAFVLVDEEDIGKITSRHKILVRTHSKENIDKLLASPKVSGFVLSGSPEIRPGFKTYDELADILEMLED